MTSRNGVQERESDSRVVVVQFGVSGAVDFYKAAGSVKVIGDVMG